MLPKVVIAAAVRTPVGSFNGSLAKLAAPELGGIVIKEAALRSGIKIDQIEEVIMGNVLQANLGQAPARQAALAAGCPPSTEATTVNKVCASGMKAIILATQSLQVGTRSIIVAGGMESMSNAPYYVPRNIQYGHQMLTDAIIKDGLWDAYNQIHMGSCGENTAKKYNIDREAQDMFARDSYRRSTEAWKQKLFEKEIVTIKYLNKRKQEVIIDEDEEYKKVNFDKIATLKPVFDSENGTITAANASTLNDGASATILLTGEKAKELDVKPLAEIISYGEAACNPIDFPIAPSLAIPIALQRANLKVEDVDLFELNEAFSVVGIVNERILGIDHSKCNIAGGAVSLGHPIGSSACRIVVTLAHLLKSGQIGCAAVCNGGGGASALVIRKL